MLMVVDVGNTNTVLGLYDQKKLLNHWRIETRKERTADEYGLLFQQLFERASVHFDQINHAIISCVVPPLLPTFETMIMRYTGHAPLVVGPKIEMGISVDVEHPDEVGADRIVNAVAAYQEHKQGLIVVDFGTATTFDVISPKGSYLGGVISPGIRISNEALFHHASKLPRVEIGTPPQVIGTNTIDSMKSGILFGYVGLVEGIVAKIESEIDFDVKVIATGGLASIITEASTRIDLLDADLTLKGLLAIYELNTKLESNLAKKSKSLGTT